MELNTTPEVMLVACIALKEMKSFLTNSVQLKDQTISCGSRQLFPPSFMHFKPECSLTAFSIFGFQTFTVFVMFQMHSFYSMGSDCFAGLQGKGKHISNFQAVCFGNSRQRGSEIGLFLCFPKGCFNSELFPQLLTCQTPHVQHNAQQGTRRRGSKYIYQCKKKKSVPHTQYPYNTTDFIPLKKQLFLIL